MSKFILTIDEGTTSERVILFDCETHQILDSHSIKISSTYPNIGWVEQNANEIWDAVKKSLITLVKRHKLTTSNTLGITITNQREALCSWDNNGSPIAPIISWQCKRTAKMCNSVKPKIKALIKQKTGLILDSYFTASKCLWLLKNDQNVKRAYKNGTLHFGTIDSWLVYNLTGGNTFATDTSNASRTMFIDITKPFEYDEQLLNIWGVKKEFLPKVLNSVDNFGTECITGQNFPILAVIGDQQSSLIGQGAVIPKSAKMTYGTGGFLLVNTGNKIADNNDKLLNTIAYSINGKTTYAIEGSIFNCGSILNYLKDTLNIFDDFNNLNDICLKTNSAGVHMIPTFTGIGAPYWKGEAKGTLSGLSFDTDKNKIAKATLESFAFMLQEILDELKSKKVSINCLTIDGGVSKTDYLPSLISSLAKVEVKRPIVSESTALGASFLGLLATNRISSIQEVKDLISYSKTFLPNKEFSLYAKDTYTSWHKKLIDLLN